MINESRVSCHTLKMQMGKLLTVSLILEVAVSLVSYWQQQFTKLCRSQYSEPWHMIAVRCAHCVTKQSLTNRQQGEP
jgi:hypothetical protein